MNERMQTARVSAFVLAGVCLLLSGCDIRPRESAECFLGALADKDLHRAGNFCSPELRRELSAFTHARRGFLYGVERFDWRLRDMGPTRAGDMAVVADWVVTRQWPAPPTQQGVVRLNLRRQGRRWLVTDGTVACEHYTEFVTNVVFGARFAMPQMGTPRWERTIALNESLREFVARYDAYCASWVR